jgi:hypothetical protein
MVGAGLLTATVWKTGDERSGWQYRFSLFRQCQSSGQVSQLYSPADINDLVKLAHVLAITLADDGCLPATERQSLRRLVSRLELLEGSED